jgi:RHS repeat-associated protein
LTDQKCFRTCAKGCGPTSRSVPFDESVFLPVRMSGSLGMKYEYDANGRQAVAKLSDNTTLQTSVYDASGQRVQTAAGGVTRTMVYDIFGQAVADYSGGSLERENIHRGGQLLATQDSTLTSQNATWTSMVGVSASGNNLTKTAGNGWGNGGAVSTQAIAAGDGYAEFSADSLDYGMYGLSHGETNQQYADIDFAIYTERAEGKVYVYENGTNLGQKGTFVNGDRFRVAIESGVVKYYKNTTLLYTSGASPTYPLLVDTSLYSSGNTLTNVVISGNLAGSAGLKYVLQDLQGSARMAMNNNGSASAMIARHDFLPFGEEIGSSIGLRTGTQGYGATDTNRQKYALTERDAASGLDHTPWRKYENTAGRWTSPDPYKGSMTIANPQSFNRYSYTQNDPVNLVDPSGLNEINNIGTFTVDVPINFGGEISSLAWYYLFWEPGGGGPGDGGLGGEPQKPAPLTGAQVDKLGSNLQKFLDDPECGKFINAMLGSLSNDVWKTSKYGGSLMDAFNRIKSGGGFWSGDTMSRGALAITNPNTLTTTFDSQRITPLITGQSWQQFGATVILAHEITHVFTNAPNAGVYGHLQMAQAASAAGGGPGLEFPTQQKFGSGDAYDKALSEYYNRSLSYACRKVKL